MKKSTVYFTDLRAKNKRTLFDKLGELMTCLDIDARYKKGQLVGVKVHFGEAGGTAYIRPVFVRRVVDRIKKTGAGVFLTDTNTLYVGNRTNSVSHIQNAIENGFDYSVTGAPIIIADGLRGESKETVNITGGKHLTQISVAREIASADAMVFLTHFKCHELTGFSGALKNIGMGCATREGKLLQHSGNAPFISPENCTACGDCTVMCPTDAIDVGQVAVIDEKLCIGCSHCVAVCPEGTIKIQWDANAEFVQEKMAEHVKGILKGKEDTSVYISFLTQISPLCDCYGHTDAPIVPDIGILASTDPVAIDQASVDLVNAEQGCENTALKSGHAPGEDKFRGTHPDIDWTVQLKHAETLGIGSRAYTLKKL